MKYISFFYILFLSLNITSVCAQDVNMLDNLLSYTSQEEFVVHNIYKVMRLNFSKKGELEVSIEGDISNVDFSFTLISVLPALQNELHKARLELKYSNLNKNNIKEALVIEAIKELYPELLYDFLIFRAECLFETSWEQALIQMDADIIKILNYTEDASNIEKVQHKFVVNNTGKSKFIVNEVEFQLIKEFYLEIDDVIIWNYFTKQEEHDYVYCLSEVINRKIQNDLKSKDLWYSEIKDHELIHNQNDIYVAIIACLVTSENIWWYSIKKFVNPLKYLANSLKVNNYKVLAGYSSPYNYMIAKNRCSNKLY